MTPTVPTWSKVNLIGAGTLASAVVSRTTAVPWAAACRDPYLVWASQKPNNPNSLNNHGAAPTIPVILQANQPLAGLSLQAIKISGAVINETYTQPVDKCLQQATHCSAEVPLAFIQNPPVWVKRLALALPRLSGNFQLPEKASSTWFGRMLPAKKPVVAVIDDQLDFLNPRYKVAPFDLKGRTSLSIFHDQNQGNNQTAWWSGQQIDQHLKTYGHSLGAYRMSPFAYDLPYRSHGSAVLQLATGANHDKGCDDVRIMAVQLPDKTLTDSSGGSLSAHALDAMRFVFDASALDNATDKSTPVVINLSMGANAGAHDGTSIFESAMDELLTLRSTNTAIVLPAGNARGDGTHLYFSIPEKQNATFFWNVFANDATDSFLEIWYPKNSNLEIQITPPYGQTGSGFITENQVSTWRLSAQDPMACGVMVAHMGDNTLSTQQKMALIALSPTQGQGIDVIAAGDYKVEIRNTGQSATVVDARVERDGAVFGRSSGGKQSQLVIDSNSVINMPEQAQLQSTGNSIGTGQQTIVVGAYRASDGEPSRYSGEGRVEANGTLTGAPTVCAVGDEGEGYDFGVEVYETVGKATYRLPGTSIAAPRVTRWIAKYLTTQKAAQNPIANTHIQTAVKAQAIADETWRGATNRATPDNRTGWGRLNP